MPQPAKPKDPIIYLVQVAAPNQSMLDANEIADRALWLDVGEVKVPPRTNLEGILEAAKTDLAPWLTDGAREVQAIPASSIRRTTVGLQQDPVLKIGCA